MGGSELNDETWHKEYKRCLLDIIVKSRKYNAAHSELAHSLHLRYKVFENVVTVMGLIAASGGFTTIAYCDSSFILQLSTGMFTVAATFLARHHSWANYQLQSREHRAVAARWGDLRNNARIQLFSKTPERAYLKWITSNFTHLVEIAPDLPKSIDEYLTDEEQGIAQSELAQGTVQSELAQGIAQSELAQGTVQSELAQGSLSDEEDDAPIASHIKSEPIDIAKITSPVHSTYSTGTMSPRVQYELSRFADSTDK